MSSKRLHLILIIALAVLFAGLLGGTYGTNKLLGSKANELTAQKAKSQALDQEQLSLNRDKKDIQTYSDLNKIAEAVVPQDKNQAEAVREIVNIAAANGVSLASITFPASTLGNLPNGTAPSTGTSGASPAPSAANTKAASLSQLTPVKSIPGVYQLPITIKSDSNHPVKYVAFINFLSALEHNRRTSQVESIALQPDPANPAYVDFNLILNEYIKP